MCAGCKFQVSTLTLCRVCPHPLSLVVIRMFHSGMLTLVCVFVHVQMETQICGNSGYDPPPLTVQIEVCYKHRNSHISAMLTLVCFFVHVQMETQICGNSWYYPPPLTHALLS